MLPADLRCLICSCLSLQQIVTHNKYWRLTVRDFITILLYRGFTLEQVNSYYTSPVNGLHLDEADMFINICTYNGEICEGSHNFLPLNQCIQMAFMKRDEKLLSFFLSFVIKQAKDTQFVLRNTTTKRPISYFRLYPYDLTWTEGLKMLFEKFEDRLVLPSIINMTINKESASVISHYISLKYNPECLGYYGYLSGSRQYSEIDKENVNYIYGRMRAMRDMNLAKSEKLTLSERELSEKFPEITTRSVFTMATMLGINIFPIESISTFIFACLDSGNVEELTRFATPTIEEVLRQGCEMIRFTELTMEQVENFTRMYVFIKENFSLDEGTEQFLTNLSRVTNCPDPHYAVITDDILRTAKISAAQQFDPGFHQTAPIMFPTKTSDMLFHPGSAIILYGQVLLPFLPHYLYTLLRTHNDRGVTRIFQVIEQCVSVNDSTVNDMLVNHWGSVPGISTANVARKLS